jgi:hypothetical protein
MIRKDSELREIWKMSMRMEFDRMEVVHKPCREDFEAIEWTAAILCMTADVGMMIPAGPEESGHRQEYALHMAKRRRSQNKNRETKEEELPSDDEEESMEVVKAGEKDDDRE